MRKAAVLGAGYMGGAVTFPLCASGVEVGLWGTWLDDEIIDRCARGAHPKLKRELPRGVTLFRSDRLSEAVDGAGAVFVAVTSEGFLPVFARLLDALERSGAGKKLPLFALTKGFIPPDGTGGNVRRISETAEALLSRRFPGRPFLWGSVGGPVKAAELSMGMATATVYGARSAGVRKLAGSFATVSYRVNTTADVAGVELSSAFKNAYAIAMGICDGMYGAVHPGNYHNIRALVFARAVREMALIVGSAGGESETVYGLAGLGDLHLTSSSGRNRRFGELIGAGMAAEEAYELMTGEGEVAEGYGALALGLEFVRTLDPALEGELPLLSMLHGVVFNKRPLGDAVAWFLDAAGGEGGTGRGAARHGTRDRKGEGF